MSERDEHDAAADKLCAWWDNHGAESIDHLSELVAADRRAAVLAMERKITCVWCGHEFASTIAEQRDALQAHADQCPEHPVNQERATSARLREALERARKMLGPHSLHPDAAGFAIIEAALADTPSDWLAEHDEKVRAEERGRWFGDIEWLAEFAEYADDYLALEAAKRLHAIHDMLRGEGEDSSLGGEGAK